MSVVDHLDHPVDVMLVGGSRELIGAFDPQCFDVLEEACLNGSVNSLSGISGFARTADRFVIDVGDVHHAMHLVTAQLQMALEQILEDIGAKISDVRVAVDRRSARVDADLAPLGSSGSNSSILPRVGVKEAKRH